MAKVQSTNNPNHRDEQGVAIQQGDTRRTFLKKAMALGAFFIKVVTEPLTVLARPTYNFAFFRARQTTLRVTQVFAVAGTDVPPPEVRVTQSFAVTGTNVPPPEVRVTQSFAVTGTNVPPPELRVTQSFVQALVSY